MSKDLVYNTLERAVSTDLNRMQAFSDSDVAEALRWLLDASSTEDGASGDQVVGTAQTAPARATILGGFLVRPAIGSSDITIDGGAMVMVDPLSTDGTDSSPCKVIVDPGIPSPRGDLQFIANASGAIRIDVIECARVPAQVVETDNRDFYNSTTGLFTPQTVPKVTQDLLQYTVRIGVPGGGYPPPRVGWLPLAVASVPDGATNWDAATIWDVRPMAADRSSAPFLVVSQLPARVASKCRGYIQAAGSHNILGTFLVEAPDGYVLGGDFDATTVVVTLSSIIEPGYAPIAMRPWYVFATAPFGLPRWAVYKPAASGSRLPGTPRGVLVFTQAKKPDVHGVPATALTLPLGTGLGGSTKNGRLLTCGFTDSGGTVYHSVANGPTVQWRTSDPLPATSTPTGTSSTLEADYTLTPGVHFPQCATRIYLRVTTDIDYLMPPISTGVRRTASLSDNDGNVIIIRQNRGLASLSGFTYTDQFEADFPLPISGQGGEIFNLQVLYTFDAPASGTLIHNSPPSIQVIGWDLY